MKKEKNNMVNIKRTKLSCGKQEYIKDLIQGKKR